MATNLIFELFPVRGIPEDANQKEYLIHYLHFKSLKIKAMDNRAGTVNMEEITRYTKANKFHNHHRRNIL